MLGFSVQRIASKIVGRDSDSNYSSINWVGHVGLVVSNHETDPTSIYNNSLISFTTKTKYWGEKYGTQGNQRLLLSTAQQIIESGIDQKFYNFTYTTGWDYYPSGTPERFT